MSAFLLLLYVVGILTVVAVTLAGTAALLLLGMRAGWRQIQRNRCDAQPDARQPVPPLTEADVLLLLDAELDHITPVYARRLADCYLIPGEDF